MWRTPAAIVEDVADVTVHAEAERRREAQRNKLLCSSTHRHGALTSEERGVERGRVGLRPIPGKVTS